MTFFDYPGEATAAPAATVFLEDATPKDWDDLLAATTVRTLSAGEVLGYAECALFLVRSGSLEVITPQGKKWKRVTTVGSGAVLGELGFLDGVPDPTLARALEPSTVAELTHTGFAGLAADRPELAVLLAMDLGRILAGRLRA